MLAFKYSLLLLCLFFVLASAKKYQGNKYEKDKHDRKSEKERYYRSKHNENADTKEIRKQHGVSEEEAEMQADIDTLSNEVNSVNENERKRSKHSESNLQQLRDDLIEKKAPRYGNKDVTSNVDQLEGEEGEEFEAVEAELKAEEVNTNKERKTAKKVNKEKSVKASANNHNENKAQQESVDELTATDGENEQDESKVVAVSKRKESKHGGENKQQSIDTKGERKRTRKQSKKRDPSVSSDVTAVGETTNDAPVKDVTVKDVAAAADEQETDTAVESKDAANADGEMKKVGKEKRAENKVAKNNNNNKSEKKNKNQSKKENKNKTKGKKAGKNDKNKDKTKDDKKNKKGKGKGKGKDKNGKKSKK